MRRILSFLILLVAFTGVWMAFQPSVALAKDPFADACTQGGAGSTVCNTKQGTTNPLVGKGGVLTNVIDIMSIVGGIIVVIVIIVGGIKYTTSNGDSAQAASAKNTIIFGLIGLVVMILARGIVEFVITKVG